MLWLGTFRVPDINGVVEIICLAALFYYILFFFRGTRAAPTLAGLALLFAALIVVTRIFNLEALNWILQRLSMYLAVAILVIFHPEIRRALAELGKRHLPAAPALDATLLEHVLEAVSLLSKRKIGALIAIERDIGMRAIRESGVSIDSDVSLELLATIFFPYTPLHDGGIIISENRLAAARCIFPLSHRTEYVSALGTRHRAALGLSEETDAIVIVVSEETGKVSCCHKGRIYSDLDEHKLSRFLSNVLQKPISDRGLINWIRKIRPFHRRKAATATADS